jgi:hypothetical protein
MTRSIDITVKRGCTLQSGDIFSTNEVVPANITYAQLLAGIQLGTYTLKSLVNKTYRGQVRDRANGTLRANLVFTVANNKMSFSVPASITAAWPKDTTTMFYDVFETDTQTTRVREAAQGKVIIQPAITE